MDIKDQLQDIQQSISLVVPELVLSLGIILILFISLFTRRNQILFSSLTILLFLVTTAFVIKDVAQSEWLFFHMLRKESFSSYIKILMNISGVLTCLLSFRQKQIELKHIPEYFSLLIAIILGGHFLVMSNHFAMVFLSLELVSISSYVIVGFANNKAGSEGSLKYFLFGAVASAIMLYGFSILYGLTGTLDFTSGNFVSHLIEKQTPLVLIAGLMALAGFLYKIAAAPMHPWAPDVYEASPIPVLAFLSVAPKLAGLGILTKFFLVINLFGQSAFDWQTILSAIAILTITIGNFSALAQKNPKRMMAYSSIAQSGFLLIGIAALLPQALQFMLFYATIYLLMNYVVFIYLDYFERRGINTIEKFGGVGKYFIVPSVFLLISLISLTGLPPTAGFTAKLFIFSSLWESYEISKKSILLWLLVFGLINTVVSLFYYLKIPYYSFLKTSEMKEKINILTFENFLAFILVFLILGLFFSPGLLMGWINKINFVY